MGCFSFILPSPYVEENEPPEFFNTLADGSLIQVIDDSSSFLAIVEDPDGEPDGVVSFVWTAQGLNGAVFVPSIPQSLSADTGDTGPRLFGSVITLPYDDTLTELNCTAFDPQGADAQRTWLLEVL